MPAVEELEVDVARAFPRDVPRDRLERGAIGHRVRSLVSHRRGKYSRSRLAGRAPRDLAIDATLRAAAVRSGRAGAGELRVEGTDLRRKVREHRSPLAIVFVVDNSYSVHADRMVEKVKGLTMELLADAANRGDRVAVVAFKSGIPEAAVALPLTRSASYARARLESIPLSGRTPLADALRQARRLLCQEVAKHRNVVPLVVCVSDGLPTSPLRGGTDPLADALAEARALRRAGVAFVAADATPRGARPGRCTELAEAAGGARIPFSTLVPSSLPDVLDKAGGGR